MDIIAFDMFSSYKAFRLIGLWTKCFEPGKCFSWHACTRNPGRSPEPQLRIEIACPYDLVRILGCGSFGQHALIHDVRGGTHSRDHALSSHGVNRQRALTT